MPIKSYLPVLKINNVDVSLSSFSYQAPAGSLGSKASVRITDVGEEIVRGDEFDLTLKITGGSQPKRNLIKDGKVIANDRAIGALRSAGLTLRNDSFSITGIDNIGERWKLAPRIPVILYDPGFVTLQNNETDSNVNDEDGERIFATATPMANLDLVDILEYAYVTGCGFSEVITNIPTYSIPRADFSLNASYHSIASSFYSLFKPLVFEDDDRLFIIDVYGEIPAGVLSGARNVTVSKYLSYSRQQPETNVVNAVLLTHRQAASQANGVDELPGNVTQRIDSESQDIGQPGADGWINNQFKRYVAELHEDEDDPLKITAEIVWKVETVTTGKDEDGVTRVLMNEVQTDIYSNSWRLKLGYTKTTDAYTDDGGGLALLQQVQTETNAIIWQPSIAHPGEYEKLYSQTQVEGLVLIENEGTDDEIRTPLLEASRNGIVPDDDSAPIERMPISSANETWRYTGADQIEVHSQKIDHLASRVQSTRTTEHVGTNAVRVRNSEAFNTKQVLLIDEDSDLADGAREPISFDAGLVSYAIAKELALRALEEAKSPRDVVKVELASFDAGIRRGSIRNLIDRDSNSVTVMVTGYGVDGLPVRMVIDGVVIG